jgi:hypothetical protein
MHRHPPRLGLFLLECLSDRNEGLAGDLIEEFHLSQSRSRFWRQLAVAIVTGGFRRPIEIRPIPLVDTPTRRQPPEDFAAKRQRLQTCGLAASPVASAGGLGVVFLMFLVAYVQPAYFILLGCALVLGAAIGVVRLWKHRGLTRMAGERRLVPRA